MNKSNSILDQFNLSNRVAVVTGAGRGLGKEMATALAEAGAKVAIVDKDEKSASNTAQEISEIGKAISIKIDVTDEDQVIDMVRCTEKELGSIDILVNNAGVVHNAPAEEMDLEEWKKIIEANMTGVFLCSKHIGKKMIENKRGNIINISSMSAFIVNVPQPQAGYNSSKAGIVMLTKSMASEWARHGVRVNAIAPGYMRTDLVDNVLKKDPKMEETWLSNTPLNRLGRPEELGPVVVFLASDASSYMTGEVLVLDGGYTIR